MWLFTRQTFWIRSSVINFIKYLLISQLKKQERKNSLSRGRVKPLLVHHSTGRASIVNKVDEYILGGVIGRGSYAVVKSAINVENNSKVAIKIYDKLKLHDPMKKKNLQREIDILKRMDHPTIIRLLKVVELTNTINLVMEFGGSQSLQSYVKQKGTLGEEETKELVKQLLDAIAYMHQKGVIHRDIKLENILINDEKNIKIIDFGFAIIPEPGNRVKIFCGTPSYMAPEIISKTINYSFGVDVWACGVLLYFMMAGTLPFKGVNEKDLYRRIESGIFKKSLIMSQGGLYLLEKLLLTNQSNRVTAEQVNSFKLSIKALKDTWLHPVDIKAELQKYQQYVLLPPK